MSPKSEGNAAAAGEVYSAGTRSASDCRATYRPTRTPLEVRVESSVAALFGGSIEAAARRVAEALGLAEGMLLIEDDGALDYVLESRVEAALRSAGFEAPFQPRVLLRAEEKRGGRNRRRRSRLYLPANQPELIPNIGLFGADSLALDLEDTVSPERKLEARVLVRRTLEACRPFFGPSEIVVRMNPLSGPYGAADLLEIVPAHPDGVILPKCESAAEVKEADRTLARLEGESGLVPGAILLMPLLETARGVLAAADIAKASPRVAALGFGAEDFARDIGARRSPAGEEAFLARRMIVLAAAAAGVQALDTVFPNIEDEQGFLASCDEARALGFSGKSLIHPRQIEGANCAFAPAESEVEEAERIVAAFAEARAAGRDVASLNGRMIDAPVAARARIVIQEGTREGD